MKKFLNVVIIIFLFSVGCFAQDTTRPPVWGIAKMTFLVSDFQVARDFYGKYLGFDEALSYNSKIGKVISFKINDRQFLEFVEDKDARDKDRLVSVSFETEEVEQMRKYLQNNGVEVPEKTSVDGAGNEVILVHDPYGIPLEFINLKSTALHRLSKGKFLSDNRISKRLHHVGLTCDTVVDNDPFYVGILGFNELWRNPQDHSEKIVMNYLNIPDCVENIEHLRNDINWSHPCFLVDDMQDTIYTLKGRKGDNELSKPTVGKGNRWLLNIKNKDGGKVEFTEAHTVR